MPAYFEHPLYIKALANSVQNHLDERRAQGMDPPDLLIASYHGLPKRFLLAGDPYHCQCLKTTRLLRAQLNWSENAIESAFQSLSGREEWLKPYTVERVAELAQAGRKNIAIIAPGFSADCVETLEEIKQEIRLAFEEAGGETLTYIPCLNTRPDHMDLLTAIIQSEAKGWLDGK